MEAAVRAVLTRSDAAIPGDRTAFRTATLRRLVVGTPRPIDFSFQMSAPMVAVDRLTKSYGRTDRAVGRVAVDPPGGSARADRPERRRQDDAVRVHRRRAALRRRARSRFDGQAQSTPRDAARRRSSTCPTRSRRGRRRRCGWALDFAVGFFGGIRRRRLPRRDRRGSISAPLLRSPIGTLSKGQRKRALLAIGMLTPHPLLLCRRAVRRARPAPDARGRRGAARARRRRAGRSSSRSTRSPTPRASAIASCC